jgi:CheY-like chemotaxis protein
MAKFEDVMFVEASPWRILVADDSATSRSQLKALLLDRSPDAVIVEVDTGEGALEKIASGAFDIVFLDLALPDINGDVVVARVRQRGRMPFFVVASASADFEHAAQMRRLAAYDYLVKPIDPQAVRRVLDIYERVTARMRVLIADASRSSREIIGRMLARSVFRATITKVSDGIGAIEAYANEPTTVVIINLDLPGIAGLDVVRVLRTYHRDVRVVVMSEDRAKLDAIPQGVDAVRIKKPFVVGELETALHDALKLPKPYGQFPEL